MTTYDTPTPVYIRVGELREAEVGTVHADHTGRIDPEEFALFLNACAIEVRNQVVAGRAHSHASKENTRGE